MQLTLSLDLLLSFMDPILRADELLVMLPVATGIEAKLTSDRSERTSRSNLTGAELVGSRQLAECKLVLRTLRRAQGESGLPCHVGQLTFDCHMVNGRGWEHWVDIYKESCTQQFSQSRQLLLLSSSSCYKNAMKVFVILFKTEQSVGMYTSSVRKLLRLKTSYDIEVVTS